MQPSQTIRVTVAASDTQNSDRRRCHRYSCDIFTEASVRHRGSMFRGYLRDISQFGCLLMTRAHLHMERHSEVDIHFNFNNFDLRATALVMNIRPGIGLGLEFSFDDPETEASFRAFIQEIATSSPAEPA
jgi:hypothetical protein